MKIFKYWAKVKNEPFVPSLQKYIPIHCWGGSNISILDAQRAAHEKANLVVQKIEGNYNSLEDYVVEIREEIVEKLDDKNIITRNRYGALVLNCEDTVILDIDQPKYGFFDFFKSFNPKQKKEKILKQIEASTSLFNDLSFRIYETRKGYRLFVSNINLRADNKKVNELFNVFHCDPLYAKLCKKQDCFRARITPKPSYIKFKARKFKYPREDDSRQETRDWLKRYEAASRGYSVCHLIKEIRPPSSLSRSIQYHDRYCRVTDGDKLG